MSEPAIAEPPGNTRNRHLRRLRPTQAGPRDPRRLRVAVVERHALVAEAVGLALTGSFKPIPVPLQSCTTTAAARDVVLRSRPDVVVVILSPGGVVDTLTLVEQVVALGISVLVTGDDLDPDTAERYLGVGASAFWHSGTVADIVDAVTREAERQAPVRPTPIRLVRESGPYAAITSRRDDEGEARRDLATLTAAEARILWALMRGKAADDIARDHVVSVATVRTQIKQVLGKLGAKSQLSAVALAWSVDWTPGGDIGAI